MTTALLAFNRGIVSRLGLARVDVKRLAMSAAQMWNFIPRVLGSMSIRPGWKYLGSTRGDAAAKLIPFVFAVNDTAVIEVTDGYLRVWRADALITRGTVGTGITNGEFTTDLTGWTDSDEAGATSSWLTGGYMQLLGDGTNAAIRDQEVTVAGGDIGDDHAITVVVSKGPVMIRVGSTAGAETYVRELALGTGTHSLLFTPAGNFHIRLFSRLSRPVLVTSIGVEAAGVVSVPAPWGADDLDNIRWDQSGDIVFVACADTQPYMIKRWAATSWGVEAYEPLDGPFRTENTTTTTITPSAITGSITLTASTSIFKSTHVGALFSLTSSGQTVTANISAQNTFTDAIRITGVDSSRVFTIILSGTWSATVTLQRSLDSEDGPWEDITAVTWTANTTETYDDGLDNQIAWYRIGVKTGQYTSGTVVATLDYALGSITGVVRITAYTSSVSVSGDVLIDLGGTDATEVWAEGAWSDYRGWPTAVAFHEGRLWWAGKEKVWGSVTDVFDSFDPDYEGDAGPISRSLGAGPVDNINWLISSQRLLIGADINEYAARSSSLDEPLTPTAFNVKVTSGQGSAAVQPGRVDDKAIFVNRTGMKLFQNSFSGGSLEYALTDLCQLVPSIGDPGITRMAVQRQPDTRVHCVRSDGTVAMLVFDATEEVIAWCEIDTDGEVEDAIVLPAQNGVTDDYVYYIVKRVIDGATVRYLEKWAQASETVGGQGLGGGSGWMGYDQYFAVASSGAISGYVVDLLYNTSTDLIYIGGPTDDAAFVHDANDLVAGPTEYTAPERIRDNYGQGIISREGGYTWYHGDNTVPQIGIKAFNTVTNTWTAFAFDYEMIVLAATEDPATRVFVAGGGELRMYQPNMTAGTMGAYVWRIATFTPGSQSWQAEWDAAGYLWHSSATVMYQVNAATGAYVTHAVPAATGGGHAHCRYDSGRNCLYVILATTLFPIAGTTYLYKYSGWASTPTADSGTWTLLQTFAPGPETYGKAMWYDAESDILFMVTRDDDIGGAGTIERFYGDSMLLLDTVDAGINGGTVPYLPYTSAVYYGNNCGYFFGVPNLAGVATGYVVRVCYNGDDLVYDEEGNLLEGAVLNDENALVDSYITYEGVPTATITGLDHLEGEDVAVWADGVDLGTDENYEQTFTVASGQITLPAEYSVVNVGLPYTARYLSSKLALQTQTEVLFGKERRITSLSLVLADTHAKGIRFGPDEDNLDDRPERDGWADVDPDNIDTAYDEDSIQFPTTWATDLRLYLQAQAPRPCTVLAVKLEIEV